MAPPPAEPAPRLVSVPFSDIGKSTKVFFDSKAFAAGDSAKVACQGTTSSGIAFTASATQKGSKVEPSIKAAYLSAKRYSVDATYESADKITCNGTLLNLAPGLKLGGAVVLPGYASSAKLNLDYTLPAVHLKSTLSLAANPTLDAAAATSYRSFLLGLETGYDFGKGAVSKSNLAVGYVAGDHQVSATLSDKAQTLKVALAYNFAPAQTLGAEVTRKISSGDTTFALGYARKLSSASAKARIDNTGALSVGYETKLAGGEKVVGSVHLNTLDLAKPPKYGFALDLF